MVLSQNEINFFKAEGYLILKNFFKPDEISIWLKEVNEHFSNPQTSYDWIEAVKAVKHSQFHLVDDPTPEKNKLIKKVFSEIYKEIEWYGINELVVTPPEPGIPWLGGRAPHLDFPLGCKERNIINITFYLNEVNSRGGAFSFWPKSHIVSYKYFQNNPNDYLARGKKSQDAIFSEINKEIITSDMIEFTGNAGDLLIWSSFLMHSATVNMSKKTRFAFIGRWGDLPVNSENHFDFNKDIFAI